MNRRDEYTNDWRMPVVGYTHAQLDALVDKALRWGIIYGVCVSLALVLFARFVLGVR